MIVMWALRNCDTCKKARVWLEANGVDFAFKDVRADGLSEDRVARWLEAVGGDVLINRRGTTWRGLGAADQARAGAPGSAVALLVENPALIKRPVFDGADGNIVVGFAKVQQDALQALL